MDVEVYTNLKYSKPFVKNIILTMFCTVYSICYVSNSGYGPIYVYLGYVYLGLLDVAHLDSKISESLFIIRAFVFNFTTCKLGPLYGNQGYALYS